MDGNINSYTRVYFNMAYFLNNQINKGKRELIMHRHVTLVAIKSSNKLKYLTLEERKLNTAKEVVIQF